MYAGIPAVIINSRGENFQPNYQMSEAQKIADAKEKQQKELLNDLKNWEDVRESNAYFTKLKVTEILCCFLTIVHLGNSVVIYELDYLNDDGDMDDDIEIQLYISTMSIFILIIMLNVRYVIEFKWMIAKKFIAKYESKCNL